MTRFYFRTRDSESVLDDDQGQDLPDLLQAVDEARRILAEMAADDIPKKNGERLFVEVAGRDRIAVVRLALTMEISYLAENNDVGG
ncbi:MULTISPECIES: DUF6894 family protein [unclassified Rhizobium]|uniref:DUF6894 family protein n=1 Tax=unclassified Rhizobium TaxID=2613769 RepID=UPI00381A359B